MYRLGIADDEPKIVTGLREFYPWEDMGFTICVQARNGQELWEYMQNNHLDVVLTDISMPVMSGIELAQKLAGTSTVIVFLSGYADFQYARQALHYNVYDYILKPVKYQELLDVFHKIRGILDMARSDAPSAPVCYYQTIVDKVNQSILEDLPGASLKSAAAKVRLSPGYLSSLYKQQTGQNLSQFILEAKMNCAGKMLSDGVLKVYQIAEKLGYEDPKNFTRAFRSFYGCSPREYKGGGSYEDC
ncbi:MAG: response regulator [Lachnospiraceae bacterium]|nr:response regulator [Lachnospiraceae bacterium]